jgi:hypothetical protein
MGVPELSSSVSSWSDHVYTSDSPTGSLSPYPLSGSAVGVDVGVVVSVGEAVSDMDGKVKRQQQQQQAPVSDMLNSQELDLLSHYITHTSRVLPFDQDDLYALHVGIPNLAFGNKPLMASILALSAASKSYDIVKHSPAPLERLDEMRELLALADKHHQTSLRQIQDAIKHGQQYDHVLANAALMVLYGSSSHCVHVSLAQMARRRGVVLDEGLLPSQSQWITLIRAAHTAYTGLLHGPSENFEALFSSYFPANAASAAAAAAAAAAVSTPSFPEGSVASPEDGPSPGTKQFLLPIVSATYRPALDKVMARARSFHGGPSCTSSELQACFAAIQILQDVYAAVFTGKQIASATDESDFLHLGRLYSVSPWLRGYLGRVTSSTPSKPLRRTIMGFLNRVPMTFLHDVQATLDRIPVAGSNHGSWDKSAEGMPPRGTPTNQLTMDIFAHWLVLVMLLDGVWWIGGIGEWELGRVLSFVDGQGWNCESDPERWWPESMYKVKAQLAEHIPV